MNRRPTIATLAFLITLVLSARASAQSALADALAGWNRDLPKAMEIAARAKKPLMVVFRCVP